MLPEAFIAGYAERRSRTGPLGITAMNINMRGKALFFKTIDVRQNETRTSFQRVPDDLTLAQAAELLKAGVFKRI